MGFVRILALLGSSSFFREFHQRRTLLLDGFVGELDCLDHLVLRYFAHLPFYHADVFGTAGHDQVEGSVFHGLAGRVDHQFAVYFRDTDLRNGTVKGNVGDGQGRRSRQAR